MVRIGHTVLGAVRARRAAALGRWLLAAARGAAPGHPAGGQADSRATPSERSAARRDGSGGVAASAVGPAPEFAREEPEYPPAPRVERATVDGVEDWYYPVLATAEMIGRRAVAADTVRAVLAVYEGLEEDAYIGVLKRYYRAGLERFGDGWLYADLVTAAYAAAELLRPTAYLEIGVRRGRSMAAVALAAPAGRFVGFDRWTPNYAGMPNPGPDFVREELRRIGHRGPLDLVSGNSHETVPAYLAAHPDAFFDLIVVDGDHSNAGAAEDIACVLPRLKVGGALLFDDISHGKHTLVAVWRHFFVDNPRFSAWEFRDLGYGIGVAVRRY